MNILSIEPKDWGPGAWKFIHSVALTYPNKPSEEIKKHYYDFFENLQYILPCPKCRNNYKDHLNKFSLTNALENNIKLFNWTVDIHNEVNKTLNKKQYSYEEVVKFYKIQYGDISETHTYLNKKTFLGVIIAIVLCGLGFFIYKKYPRRLINIR